jgi:hypothetical protein
MPLLNKPSNGSYQRLNVIGYINNKISKNSWNSKWTINSKQNHSKNCEFKKINWTTNKKCKM